MKDKFTPNYIEFLEDNEVFVFGSNLDGYHLGGAARIAKSATLFGRTVKLLPTSVAGNSRRTEMLTLDMVHISSTCNPWS